MFSFNNSATIKWFSLKQIYHEHYRYSMINSVSTIRNEDGTGLYNLRYPFFFNWLLTENASDTMWHGSDTRPNILLVSVIIKYEWLYLTNRRQIPTDNIKSGVVILLLYKTYWNFDSSPPTWIT